MTSSLFSEAMEYYSLEPFGAERDNIHAGLIASTIANVHISNKAKMMKPADFMLKDTNTLEAEKVEAEKAKIDELMNFMKGMKNG